MIPSILYQDENFIVCNKPAGMVVNRAESVKGETVQEWIEMQSTELHIPRHAQDEFYKSTNESEEFYQRAGIVHRIDKETSGILLIAKTPHAFSELQRQFKSHEVGKTYLALVHGEIPREGHIHVPVGRLPWNRERFGVVAGGKEAKTRFQRISNFKYPHDSFDKTQERSAQGEQILDGKEEKISLVQVFPETGRTHQIRVHLKYLGYPIVGDYLYGGRKQSRQDRTWAPRVMLHAWKISFFHPKTHVPLAFEAPIPDDMKRIIPQSTNYE